MQKQYLIFTLLALALTLAVSHQPFFWDTVQLASKHGHFFYENGFAALILPEEIDSGHVPTFGLYIAFCWKIFGKTLAVSHLAMLPFLLGTGYFLLKIGRLLADEKQAPWLLALCFADPVLASQSALVSPDVALVFFFLMGLYSLLSKRSSWFLTVAVAGLGLISMRGMMVAVGLYMFSLVIENRDKNASCMAMVFQKTLPFLPGGLLAASYLFYHWYQTGWIGHHAGSPWAPSYELVDFRGFLKNIAVVGWRLLDFGRVFVWLGLLFYFREFFQKSIFKNQKLLGRLVALSLLVFAVSIPMQMVYKGLLAHRYMLPFFLCIHLLLFFLIFGKEDWKNSTSTRRPWLASVVVLGLLMGNLWIYPKKISQGWDSTLAHLPWYGLVGDAKDYLRQQNIPLNEVGTAFPNIGPREWYELDGNQIGFEEKDFSRHCFILYSNVMNDFTDGELDELEANWPVLFHAEKRGVCLLIYKNPNQEICAN